MKKYAIVALMAIAVAMFTGCGNSSNKSDESAKNDEDSLSYALGLTEGQRMQMALNQLGVDSQYVDEFLKGVKAGLKKTGSKKQDAYNKGLFVGLNYSMGFKQQLYPQLFANDSTKTLPMDKFVAGLKDGMKGKFNKMNPQQAQEVFQRNAQRISQRYFEKAYGPNKKASDAYIANVSKQPGVKQLSQGVYYKEVKPGNGNTPTAQDMTKVTYVLKDINGNVLDKGENAEMPVSGMIPGWTQAIMHMKEGATWEVYLSYDVAYGTQDKGKIKPFSALHFTITLISVEKAPQGQQQGGQMPVQVR